MTINLPLGPNQEAKLLALARAKGLTPDDLVRASIEKMLGDAPEVDSKKRPTRSSRGILSQYGPAPSEEEIDQNRAEMFGGFVRD